MERWQMWLLITLALGVIISNILLLKQTAHFKVPKIKNKLKTEEESKQWDNDDWGDKNWHKNSLDHSSENKTAKKNTPNEPKK